MSLDKIVRGDYGQPILVTFIDIDTKAAADISGYATTLQMIFTNPSGSEKVRTAAFDTDGTDGVIAYTLAVGDIDAAGDWKVRGRVASGTAVLSTEDQDFTVLS